MLDSIRSEWIKASTLTSIKVLIAFGIAFPIVIVMITTGFGSGIWNSADLTDLISGLVLVTVLLLGVVSVMGATGEYTYNTIRPTFAAQPGRVRPLLAKVVVHLALSLAVGVIVLALSWWLGSMIVGSEGYFPLWSVPTPLGGTETTPTLPAFAGILVLVVGVTFIGIGLGLLMRNIAAATSMLLLWPLLLETLVRGVFSATDKDDWSKYLPFAQGVLVGFWDMGSDNDAMSRIGASVYFLVWAVGVLVLGLWRSTKSDA